MASSPPPAKPSGDASPGAPSGASDSKAPASPRSGPPRLQFPVAGIGASAGGLEALEALTQRLSADRMAFVVVQHLAPAHVSMLADILKRGTSLRVVTIEYGMHLNPGIIYV